MSVRVRANNIYSYSSDKVRACPRRLARVTFVAVISAKLLICESMRSTMEYMGHSKVLMVYGTVVVATHKIELKAHPIIPTAEGRCWPW